ncbi:DMT family transporter [Agrobacterium rhizogenes]|uniref:DMT family transporter n=1 Tax=Rhizobium rhizogenes TaxID=359 RepID=UPI001573012A|nr:DMT family transporter [Rhizobium rhizogenes]NTG51710.1 DMT family transporter [Rhizobium rhizogenes]
MKILPHLAITLAMFLWSINFIVSKDVFQAYSPMAVIFMRLFIASLFIFIVKKIFHINEKIRREHLPTFALLSFFSPFLYFIGEGYGIFLTPSTLSALIVATVPVVFPAIGFIFLGERIGPTGIVGLIIAFVGILITIIDPTNFSLAYSPEGLLFLLLSVGSAIAYIILAKHLLGEYKSITVVSIQNLFGSLYFLPVVALFDSRHILSQNIDYVTVLKIAFLGIFCSAVAYILYSYAIARLALWQANAFENLIPIFSAILSFLWLNEMLSTKSIVGFCIVIAGIVVSQLASFRSRRHDEG